MHDDLEPFSQSPSQKFCKNLFDFEKPQNFSTNPKNWVRMHEMYDKRLEKRSYLWNMNEKTKEWVGKMKRLSEKSLGVREKSVYRERLKRNEIEIAKHIYIEVL